MLLRKPGLTLAVLLSMAIGIGTNTTHYVWIVGDFRTNGRRASVPGNRDRGNNNPARDSRQHGLSGILGLSLHSRGEIADLLVFADGVEMALGATNDREQPERLWGNLVSGNYFDVLGIKPVLGRTFIPE